MRIAIAGKGGSGKTTVAGAMARLIAREGRRVVAIDGDTNPNLAQSLGVAGDPTEVTALPADLLERRENPDGTAYTELALPVEAVLERHGVEAADGVRLLVMGRVEHAGKGCKCRAHAIARTVIGDLLAYSGDGEVLVDMEAGLEHLSRGTTRHVDALLAVAEPYYRSLETGRRVCELARELGIGRVWLVANKVRDGSEAEAIREYARRHDLPLAGLVPYDEAVARADLRGEPPLDGAGPDSPAIAAIRELVRALDAGAPELQPTPAGA